MTEVDERLAAAEATLAEATVAEATLAEATVAEATLAEATVAEATVAEGGSDEGAQWDIGTAIRRVDVSDCGPFEVQGIDIDTRGIHATDLAQGAGDAGFDLRFQVVLVHAFHSYSVQCIDGAGSDLGDHGN